METIGERIRRLRTAAGLARKDLAKRAGLSYTGLSDLESGKAKSTTKLHHFAAILGVDVNYLETGTQPANGVRDASPAYQASQCMRLDPEMLRDVYQAITEIYEEQGLVYKLDLDPELFAEMYLDRMAIGDIRSRASVVKIGRWMERKTSKGTEKDERDPQVPAKGTTSRKAGGGWAKR